MNGKNQKITVQGSQITILSKNEQDYISLTDMVRDIENGLVLIEKWLRNKNTIEFLGIWEEIYNPVFNSPEFEGIKNQAGLNRFALSVKQWVKKPAQSELSPKLVDMVEPTPIKISPSNLLHGYHLNSSST